MAGVLLTLVLVTSCTGKKNPPAVGPAVAPAGVAPAASGSGTGTEVPGQAGPAWTTLSLLETGENPLWFELNSGGPSLIDSPGSASLAPFTPWPYARYIIGMQIWDNFLVMASNRDGFLILGPADDAANVVLYRAASGGIWDPYTAESFFTWEDKPAVLIYRNDFFADLNAPSPRPQVYLLDKSSPVPLAADIPALEIFPSDHTWETEVVHRGADGFWYYRMKEKGEVQDGTAYFRSRELDAAGEKISFGDWINSNNPEKPENAPAVLKEFLYKVSKADLGKNAEVKAVSPDFDGPRFFDFAGSSAETENPKLMYTFSREKDSSAIAIVPDGRGLYSNGNDDSINTFSLPALPEGFVYTGLALIGKILAATWEEQQEAGIGAAGFMVIDFDKY